MELLSDDNHMMLC